MTLTASVLRNAVLLWHRRGWVRVHKRRQPAQGCADLLSRQKGQGSCCMMPLRTRIDE
jgi:hypothetical protein